MHARRSPRTRTALLAALLVAAATTGQAAGQGMVPPQQHCKVPNLRGKTLLQIEYHHQLQGLGTGPRGCTLGRVVTRAGERASRGRPLVVVSQNPRPGTQTAYFAKVSLVLARAPARKPARCRVPTGADVVARTAAMLVYRTYAVTKATSEYEHDLLATSRACVRSTGLRRAIQTGTRGSGATNEIASNFAVAGAYVAYTTDSVESKYTGGDTYRRLYVFDVTAGKRTFEHQIGMTRGSFNNTGAPAAPQVLAVVVNDRGFVAWLSRDVHGTSVFAHDSNAARVIDQSPGNALGGLRLRGNTLTWTKDGAPQSAPLS